MGNKSPAASPTATTKAGSPARSSSRSPSRRPVSVARPISKRSTEERNTKDWPEVGDYVEAKLEDWSQFYGGFVRHVEPTTMTYHILFDDGEMHKNVRFVEIRRPALIKRATSNGPAHLDAGTRVTCKIAGMYRRAPPLTPPTPQQDGNAGSLASSRM